MASRLAAWALMLASSSSSSRSRLTTSLGLATSLALAVALDEPTTASWTVFLVRASLRMRSSIVPVVISR